MCKNKHELKIEEGNPDIEYDLTPCGRFSEFKNKTKTWKRK